MFTRLRFEEEVDDEGNEVKESADKRVVFRRSKETLEGAAAPKRRTEGMDNTSCPLIYPVFDSHFHLDRTSRRISGSVSRVTIEALLGQQMERPPTVPINIRGGLLIYCDPGTYPATVPFDGK